MPKARVHLRHTGTAKPRVGVTRLTYYWGYNIDFGRFFIAIREKRPNEIKRPFIDLKFGREQVKYRRLMDSMTDTERDAYFNCNPQRYRLEYFLEMHRSQQL